MSEKYNITLQTPKGIENGTLEINISGGRVSGEIISKTASTSFVNGELIGKRLIFSGKIKIAFINVNYNADCIIEGENLKGVVKTKFGDFKVSGKKVN